MENLCNRVQEEIAWGRALSTSAQEHVITCAQCKQIAFEFAELEALVDQHFDVEVPEGFADQVMLKIANESHRSEFWSEFGLNIMGPVLDFLTRARFVFAALLLFLMAASSY